MGCYYTAQLPGESPWSLLAQAPFFQCGQLLFQTDMWLLLYNLFFYYILFNVSLVSIYGGGGRGEPKVQGKRPSESEYRNAYPPVCNAFQPNEQWQYIMNYDEASFEQLDSVFAQMEEKCSVLVAKISQGWFDFRVTWSAFLKQCCLDFCNSVILFNFIKQKCILRIS